MAVEEGDAATALKQRLPRGAEHRGAGDPDRAAIWQCISPTPKREAHPTATARQLHQAGPQRSSRPPPSCCQPTQGTRTGAAPSLLHTTSLTPRLPRRTRGLPKIGYFLRALLLRTATNTEPRLCHAAAAPSPVLALLRLPGDSKGKASVRSAGDPGSIPGSAEYPGE